MLNNLENEYFLKIEEMAKNGLHLGHRVSKTNPQMKQFIIGVKNSLQIIDLEKTLLKLKEALDFIKSLSAENKTLLLVGTHLAAKKLIQELGKELNLPYVEERWLGGTLTNFNEIRKRIDLFESLEKEKENGGFLNSSKKEKIKKEKNYQSLKKKVGGLKGLKNLPDAVFICSLSENYLAAKEARDKKIKTIAIVDTDSNPTLVDFPIPASDDSVSSLRYILEKVKIAWQKGKGFSAEQPSTLKNSSN
jgi:small subunit ribosomal protein S2